MGRPPHMRAWRQFKRHSCPGSGCRMPSAAAFASPSLGKLSEILRGGAAWVLLFLNNSGGANRSCMKPHFQVCAFVVFLSGIEQPFRLVGGAGELHEAQAPT